MRIFDRYALIGAAAALLAGCGGSQPIGAPGAIPQNRAIATHADRGGSWTLLDHRSYSVLFSFDGNDGETPTSLLNVKGTLYGTTITGGAGSGSKCFYFSNFGCGTVFSVTPAGEEHVLYSFTGAPNDGAFPKAGLINVHGILYGTTSYGGAYNRGTVFSITTTGEEHVLHSFTEHGFNRNGDDPEAPLLDVDGTLYGTTAGGGGRHSSGTVFGITTAGNERVLHRFHGNFRDGYAPDGYAPYGGLINVSGTLYGTTNLGGSGYRGRARRQIVISGSGTVFSITTTGQEHSLYSFTNSPDGARPAGSLTDVGGTIYGTTTAGGSTECAGGGCGTVFSITTAGQEKVLHEFTLGRGGWFPAAGMVNSRGTLYGTTQLGGTGCSGFGCGVVYAVTTSGKETVLYRFAGIPDGANPTALIDVKGTLYGTTGGGGAYGDGTIFSLKP